MCINPLDLMVVGGVIGFCALLPVSIGLHFLARLINNRNPDDNDIR